MKIKLYTARELDKKFPSGKWNGINVIKRTGHKAWWEYFGITRCYYDELARKYLKVVSIDDAPPFIAYATSGGIIIPEIFVKKVKQ